MTLFELFALLRKHLVLVITLPIITGVITLVVAILMPNEYTASTTMYVLSREGLDEVAVTQSDLSAGQMLTNDVATLMKSERIQKGVAEQLNMQSLDAYKFKVTNSSTTRVITLEVTGKDPVLAADIANATVKEVSRVASDVMKIESVNVIDAATVPTAPSGPRRSMYTAIGILAGLFFAVAIVVVRDTIDTRVRDGEEAEELVGVPVVSHFPVA